MSNVFDMLEKAGYEAQNIGSEVLPCTLMKDGMPIGFLMPDFSTTLVSGQEAERDKLQPLLAYCINTQELEELQGERKLSQYRDTVFTAVYDFEQQKPIYNIYSVDKDKNLTIIGSSYEKDKAAQEFASRSGLVGSAPAVTEQRTTHLDAFIEAVKQKGYNVLEAVKGSGRAYEIRNAKNKVVAYIGRDNRFTLVTDNAQQRRFLTNTYIQSKSAQPYLPGFFEKLRVRLQEFGMALKVLFSSSGRHYAIQDEKKVTVATVAEDTHKVTYTDRASEEQKRRIDALVEEIQRENSQRQKAEQKTVPEAPSQDVPAPEVNAETLISSVEEVQKNNKKVVENQEKPAPEKEKPTQEPLRQPPEPIERAYTDEEKVLLKEFTASMTLLKTVEGFNPAQKKMIEAEMMDKFGTTTFAGFTQKLDAGEYSKTKNLSDRLKDSKEKASRQNAARQQPEQTKEQSKEKERN